MDTIPHQLRDLLNGMLAGKPDEHIDMAKQLARCTLDIIGIAGESHCPCSNSLTGVDSDR